MRVGLVFGGHTTEADVSRHSAEGVRGALKRLGHEVVDIEFDKNAAMHIQDANVDVVFNAMHGQYGEDGRLQGLLDIMQIPYTHSGVLSSAIGMNKRICNNVFKNIGLRTIRGFVATKDDLSSDKWKEMLKNSEIADCKEVFVKPVSDGSSRDAFLIHNVDEYSFKTTTFATACNEFLIEERIIGREIQVAVVDDKAIGMLEVMPNANQSEFYDYTAKYSEGGAVHKPVEASEEIKQQLLDSANSIHKTLGLNCVSRSEFLLAEDNKAYVLEVNTHPGLTSLSIVPEIANNAGISYEQLVNLLLKSAKFG